MHAVVAGAGVSGIFSAAALAARGWRVTLLERLKGPDQGLSYAPGFLSFAGLQNPLLYPLFCRAGFESSLLGRLRSRPFFRHPASHSSRAERLRALRLADQLERWCALQRSMLAARFGLRCDTVPGLLELLDEPEAALLSELLPEAGLRDRDAVLMNEPSLSAELPFTKALLVPEAGAFNGVYLSRQLLARLQSGCSGRFSLRCGEALSGLRIENGRVQAVKTSSGAEIQCDAAVLACAGEAIRQLVKLGVQLPAAAFTGCTMTLESEDEGGLPERSLFIPSRHLAIVRMDQRLRITGKLFLGPRTEAEKRAEYNRIYDAALGALVNCRPRASSIRFWSATVEALPDGFPAAGLTKAAAGLAVSAAHGLHGLQTSLGAAAIIASALSEEDDPGAQDFAQACSPDRFSR